MTDKQALLGMIYGLNPPLPESARARNAEEEFEARIGRRLAAGPAGALYFISRDNEAHLMTRPLMQRIHAEIKRKAPVLAGMSFSELRDRVLQWVTTRPIHRIGEEAV